MTFASVSQFHITYHGSTPLTMSLNSVLNVKALVGTFIQEKALVVGAFYVILKIDGSFAALIKIS